MDEHKLLFEKGKKQIWRKGPYIYDVLTEGEMAWDSLNLSPLNNKNIVPFCRWRWSGGSKNWSFLWAS